jgi:hypothetical protein
VSEKMCAYFCLSEDLMEGGGYYEPPEDYNIVEIVAARNASQARYLAWKGDSSARGCTLADMPRFATRRLGAVDGPARVLSHAEAEPWWVRVPEGVTLRRRPTGGQE